MRVLLITIAFFALACSSAKKTNETTSENKSQIIENPKDSLFLYFERTICFGECPAFRITVYSDGKSVYEGLNFVEKLGIYDAQLSTAAMKEIRGEAERIGFFELQNKYDASVSDVPTCITMISRDEGRKRIEDTFCWQIAAREMNDFYTQMLDEADADS